jgi:hypothetical protein
MRKYRKFSWIGNRIDDSDMALLHHISKRIKKPITILIRESVKEYLAKGEKL